MDYAKLRRELKRDEGFRQKPYRDSVGKLTIGYGWNLSDNGLPPCLCEELLSHGIDEAIERLDKIYPEWSELSSRRQHVLVNMAYNLGGRLREFKRMFKAIEASDYQLAAGEMLNSKWAEQVGKRAQRLAKEMQQG